MTTVWIVTKSYPTLDLVDDDLDIRYADVGEVVGVFRSEKKAREFQEELININARDVIAYDCDPIDVAVAEWEVE